MLQLLLAGLRGGEDAGLYRRKHVFELAMALHDSSGEGGKGGPWRAWPQRVTQGRAGVARGRAPHAQLRPASPAAVAEPTVAALALRLLCTATYIPRAARQLSQESGFIPWLAGAAAAALRQLLQPRCSGPPDGAAATAADALAALRRLLQLRAVMRGGGGVAAAQQMTAAAQQLAAAALGSGAAAKEASRLVLPFLVDVQQLLGTRESGGQPAKRAHVASGLALAELEGHSGGGAGGAGLASTRVNLFAQTLVIS